MRCIFLPTVLKVKKRGNVKSKFQASRSFNAIKKQPSLINVANVLSSHKCNPYMNERYVD